MPKVFGYIRVSTTEQAANGDSLDAQRNQVTGWAMVKGWEIAEIFVEAGVSGSVPLADRPEGAKLLARAGKGDIVITPKLDRMFRSAADALTVLESLKAEGVGLHMIDMGGDVTGNGLSKMLFTILAAVAEGERDRLRERIREVKANLRAKGVYAGGKPPFGYIVVDKVLVIDPEATAKIERIKALRLEGKSLSAIGEEMDMFPMTVKRVLDRVAKGL